MFTGLFNLFANISESIFSPCKNARPYENLSFKVSIQYLLGGKRVLIKEDTALLNRVMARKESIFQESCSLDLLIVDKT